jgi:hypothetical protein
LNEVYLWCVNHDPCVFVNGHLADFEPFDDVGLVLVSTKNLKEVGILGFILLLS